MVLVRRLRRHRAIESPLMGLREDPLAAVANLFDLALVFVALLVALVATTLKLPELLNPDATVTIIKQVGAKDMEILVKRGKVIKAYRATDFIIGGRAKRLGVAYQLEDGQIIYVPDEMQAPPKAGKQVHPAQ